MLRGPDYRKHREAVMARLARLVWKDNGGTDLHGKRSHHLVPTQEGSHWCWVH